MSCLHHLVAILPLVAWTDAGQIQAETYRAAPRRYVVVEPSGRAPVVILGSDEVPAREDLLGTWDVVFLEHAGEPRPDIAADLQMRFSRGRLELIERGRPTIVVAYSLETRQYPGQFGWTLRRGGCIFMQKGVLWQEGDTLTLCVAPINQRRATEFLTQPGDGRTLFVLKRAKLPGDGPSQPGV